MKRDYERAIRKIRKRVVELHKLAESFPKRSCTRAQFESKAGTFNEVACWLNEAIGAEERLAKKQRR